MNSYAIAVVSRLTKARRIVWVDAKNIQEAISMTSALYCEPGVERVLYAGVNRRNVEEQYETGLTDARRI